MDARKRKKLKAAGWRVGNAEDFLNLSPAEATYVEIKLRLARLVKEQRLRVRKTQQEVASLVGSSQSRVARMEAGDGSVSLDLLVQAALDLGITTNQLATAFRSQRTSKKSAGTAA